MAGGNTQAQAETLKDFGPAPEGIVERYVAEIELYEAKTKAWRERAKKIVERYRDERESTTQNVPRFNLLWSNLQTTMPIYYAKIPKADVQRRFKDQDPVGRVACEIAERSLDYSIECDDRFDRTMKQGTEDFALVGRGVSWQRYVPHFRGVTKRIDLTLKPKGGADAKSEDAIARDGVQISNEMLDDGDWLDSEGNSYDEKDRKKDERGVYTEKQIDVLDYEETLDDYVNWEDFGHNAGARVWDEVYLVWRVAYLTRDELHARFDAIIGKNAVDEISLDYEPGDMGRYGDDIKNLFKKARVYEMWDKSKRKAVWICKGYKEKPLDMRDDPLRLTEFFPCPKPVYATTSNNTMVPIPDYAQYQDQAAEIDNITARIALIEKAIRVRGLYPANIDAIRTLLTTADDNDMVALDQATIATILGQSGGDLSKIVYFWPVDILVKCLEVLIKLRAQLIDDVYQITGFGDILRGVSEPRETATASELKSQWGSLRVRDRQKEIQRYARDALRLKFEIIFNHYEDETIWLISSAFNIPELQRAGKEAVEQAQKALAQQAAPPMPPAAPPQLPPIMAQQIEEQAKRDLFNKALALLRDSALRHFRVDIETDSTVAPDDGREKQRYNEMLAALGAFFAQVAPVVEKAPMFAPFIGELLMKGVRLYKTGSSLESTLETAVQSFMQIGSQGGGDAGGAEAQAKVAGEKTKQAKIASEDRRTASEERIALGEQEIERGRLGLESLVAERDTSPQVVVQ